MNSREKDTLKSRFQEREYLKRDQENESPVDIAFKRIKDMMFHHEIVPGQKLLYKELAKKLGMSVTPIIQALNRLQLLNIVYSERNKGYYVGEADPTEAKELLMAREALETYIVPFVIENLTGKKLSSIENAMKKHVTAGSSPQYRRILLLKDVDFHLSIIECAENRVIYNQCKLIFEQIYLKYRPEYVSDQRIRETAKEHKELFKALKSQDVKKTRQLIKRHIKKGSQYIVDSLLLNRDLTI